MITQTIKNPITWMRSRLLRSASKILYADKSLCFSFVCSLLTKQMLLYAHLTKMSTIIYR